MPLPRPIDVPLAAVFLDAGGTLFVESPSRAALYADVARARGLDVTERAMRELMYRTHAQLPRSIDGHFRYSEAWFGHFIARIFVGALGLPQDALAGAQSELFARFADPRNFRPLPGARELLAELAARGLKLGVVSNWSERLDNLLDGLGLAEHLDFALASAVEGCEKPQPEIFQLALSRAGVSPAQVVHAGNDVERDVHGARGVGILPVLVDWDDRASDLQAARVRDLFELKRWLLNKLV